MFSEMGDILTDDIWEHLPENISIAHGNSIELLGKILIFSGNRVMAIKHQVKCPVS